MNKVLLAAVTTLVLSSGALYAASSSGQGGCDGDSRGGKDARHSAMHAGEHAKDPEQMQQRMLDRLGQRLGLTEQQRQQISEVLDPVKMPGLDEERHAQMQAFRTQMQDLDPAAATYLDEVAALAEQKAALMSQQMLERARQHAQIFALLTPEQQQTFKQMKPHRGDREGRHSRS